MVESLKGIVLKAKPYRENGLLLTLLSDTHGKINVLARGARRTAKRAPLYTEMFAYSDFCVFFGRGVPLCDNVEVIEPFYALRESLDALSLAQYFAALCDELGDSVPDQRTLRLLLNSLSLLCSHKVPEEDVKLVFELKYLQYQGLAPVQDTCAACGAPASRWVFDRGLLCERCAGGQGFTMDEEALKLLGFIFTHEGADMYRFKVSDEEKRYVSSVLQNDLSYQFDTRFPSLDYYKKY